MKIPSEDDPILMERGKSRGSTRSGRRTDGTSNEPKAGGLSDIIPTARPPILDSEIEKCDGSWEYTRDTLGTLITKPKLTEKLLLKPPFRFLHDIFMEIIRVTGFASNLYTPEEMDSANISERNQKIEFLEKMSKLIGMHLNTIIDAKSAKIVAGLEPEKTNNLLQLLAVAVTHLPGILYKYIYIQIYIYTTILYI